MTVGIRKLVLIRHEAAWLPELSLVAIMTLRGQVN
jgi:hypothetical protein